MPKLRRNQAKWYQKRSTLMAAAVVVLAGIAAYAPLSGSESFMSKVLVTAPKDITSQSVARTKAKEVFTAGSKGTANTTTHILPGVTSGTTDEVRLAIPFNTTTVQKSGNNLVFNLPNSQTLIMDDYFGSAADGSGAGSKNIGLYFSDKQNVWFKGIQSLVGGTTTTTPTTKPPTTPPTTSPTTPPTAATTSKSIAVSAGGTFNAADANYTFQFAAANYTYSISGFNAGDVLQFPAGQAATVNNTSFTDGQIDVQWAYNGNVVTATLKGLTNDQDIKLLAINDLSTLFGAGTVK